MRSPRLFSLVLGLAPLLALAGCDDGSSDDSVAAVGGMPAETGGGSTTGGTGGEVAVTGGTGTETGGAATGGASSGLPGFGTPVFGSSGTTENRWHKINVTRSGVPYYFMANGWGPGFVSQTVSWAGTSFTVDAMEGVQGPQWQPASYPTVFCGAYSDSASGACGLPRAIDTIEHLYTGWRWNPNGNTDPNVEYNAAYDIWVGNGPTVDSHNGFLMVWLHEPAGQQPAGSLKAKGVSVPNVPGVWDIWASTGAKPCVSYVLPTGQDMLELEFDVMDFWRDLPARQLSLNSTHILSVAVGFEIWNGPITNLVSEDFYVDVR